MKVLVTGGAGFIGSHVIERLLAQDETVVSLDNFLTGQRRNLTDNPRLTIVEGDISDQVTVRETIGNLKPDLVVHCAASYDDPNDWNRDARVNTLGTALVAQAAKDNGCERMIYLQTALCYGVQPQEQPITLNHPILPGNSSYAISKTAGEQYIELSGMDYVTFRLSNVYGPRNLSGPLPIFFKRLIEGKPCFVTRTRRDYIFVDDMVDCIMRAIAGKGQGAYHISSGGDVSIKELFEQMVSTLRINLERPVEERDPLPDDAETILLDPSRTIQDFDWAVSTPLNEGVQRTVDYYREFGVERSFTHLKADRK